VLKNYVQHIQFANDNYQAMIALKTDNLQYLAATAKYAWLMGYDDSNKLIGKTDHELNNPCIRNYAEYYQNEDRLVLVQKTRITTINNHYFADNSSFSVWQFDKIPVMDNDRAVAILVIGTEIYEYPELLRFFQNKFGARAYKLVSEKDELISPLTHLKVTLSNYQLEICFLSLLGYNNTQLAEFFNQHKRYLSLGKVRTENNIKQMKLTICNKLGFIANSQHNIFVDQLMELKFYHYVPLSLYRDIFSSRIILA